MQIASVEGLSLYDRSRSSQASSPSAIGVAPALVGIDMLRRGIDTAVDRSDRPDQRYWTAYDHFMVEREARKARTAHIGALCAKGVAALRKWLA
jgi:hypothetical protein